MKRRPSTAFLLCAALFVGVSYCAGRLLRERIAPSSQVALLRFQPLQSNQMVAGNSRGGRGAAPQKGFDERAATSGRALFEQVYGHVEEQYVDKLPSETEMAHGAARSLLAALNDPQAQFVDREMRAVYEAEAEGRFAGVGAATAIRAHKRDGYTEHRIVVVAPLPNSPAEKAGLQSGDVVTHINGRWILGASPFLRANKLYRSLVEKGGDEEAYRREYEAAQSRHRGGLPLADADKRLRSGAGAEMKLTIAREGSPQPLSFTLRTAVTPVQAVSYQTLPEGVGYLRVAALTDNAGPVAARALRSLPPNQSLLVDLRGCAGGAPDSLKPLVTALAGGGAFLAEEGARNKRTVYTAPQGPKPSRSLLVLVNSGTASTAEALALALREKTGAKLMGARTFGDGAMQTLYPLEDGSGFTLSTGRMLSPKGVDWSGAGLAPDSPLPAGLTEEQILARAASEVKRLTAAAPKAK